MQTGVKMPVEWGGGGLVCDIVSNNEIILIAVAQWDIVNC